MRSPLLCAIPASPGPDHALITGDSTAFAVPTTIRGKQQAPVASPAQVSSAREGASPLNPGCWPTGPAAAGLRPAGATDVDLTTRRMQEHWIPRQRSGRWPWRGGRCAPEHAGRGSARSSRRCLRRGPSSACSRNRQVHVAGQRPWPPCVAFHRSPRCRSLFRPILRGTRRPGLRKSGSAWRHANLEPRHLWPDSWRGRLAQSAGTRTTHGRAKVPPKRCHRGGIPPWMPRRRGQPPECSPSAPTR
jgi:hypothetical protein